VTGWRAAALAALLLAAAATGGAARAEGPPPQRMVTDAEAPAYAAVGRLNLTIGQYCTATLIGERLVLTAAHCVHHPVTGRRVRASEMRFVAGYRKGGYAALRGVAAVAVLPGYDFKAGIYAGFEEIRRDLALLELEEPIPAETVAPARIGAPRLGAGFWSVGYGADRAEIASIREGCTALEEILGVMRLDCRFVAGGSGSPVFAPGPDGPELVAVLSAAIGPRAEHAGRGLAVEVAPALDMLRAALEAETGRAAP
jgi:protease YdgD